MKLEINKRKISAKTSNIWELSNVTSKQQVDQIKLKGKFLDSLGEIKKCVD